MARVALHKVFFREFIAAFLLVFVFSTAYLYNVGAGYGADVDGVCLPKTTALTSATHDACVDACKTAYDTCASACGATDAVCVGACSSVEGLCVSDCLDDVDVALFTKFDDSRACARSLPLWVQASVIGIGVYLVYAAVGMCFASQVQANPLISVAELGIENAKNSEFGRNFLQYFLASIGQIVGVGSGAIILWLFADLQINQIQNVYHNQASPSDSVSGVQIARAFISEVVGAFLLVSMIVVLYAATIGGAEKLSYSRRGRFVGAFYLVYMLIFWIHSKLTVDIIRGGWLCIVATFDDTSVNCSIDNSTGVPWIVWFLLVHVGLILIAGFSCYYIAKAALGRK